MKHKAFILLLALLYINCKRNDQPFAFSDFSQLGASVPGSKLKNVRLLPSALATDDLSSGVPEVWGRYETWVLTPEIPVIHKLPTFNKRLTSSSEDSIIINKYRFSLQKIIQTDNIQPMINEVYSFEETGSKLIVLKVIDVSGGSNFVCFLLVFRLNDNGTVTCLNEVSNVSGKSWLVENGLFNYAETQNRLQVILLNKEASGFELWEVHGDKLAFSKEGAQFTQTKTGCLQIRSNSKDWPIKPGLHNNTDPCSFNFQSITTLSYAEMNQQK